MDFDITDDQEALIAAARAVLAKECPITFVRQVLEHDGSGENDLWPRMVELGWPALTVPVELGGLGQGFVEQVLLFEELGRTVTPGPMLATTTQFLPALEEGCTDEQQQRFIVPLCRGDLRGALAVSEVAGSWRPQDVRLSALRRGGEWVLNGAKQTVVDGHLADEVVVAARVDEGIGMFVVPAAAVDVTPVATLDATRPYATLELRDVVVGADRVIGVPGQADMLLERALDKAITTLAAEMVGTCQTIFDVTLQYAKDRVQFDRPIGSFQAIQHKLADMLIALEKARSTCYFAAMAIAEDDPRRALAAASAKAAAGECQRLIAKEGIQIHGGIAYTWEHDMHILVKRVKAADALFGNTSEHHARIADLLGV